MPETADKSWTWERIVAEGLDPRDWEIDHGVLVERRPSVHGMPEHPVSWAGGQIVVRLGWFLAEHVEARGLGAVLGGERFIFGGGPRQERRPDLAFVTTARFPAGPAPGPPYVSGAPDLAIEVLSPTDSLAYQTAKAEEYLERGAHEAWIVCPELQSLFVLRHGAPPRAYSRGQVLESPGLLPGFSLSLERLFALPYLPGT